MNNKVLNKIFIIIAIFLLIVAIVKIFNLTGTDKQQQIAIKFTPESKILIYSKEECRFCAMAKALLERKDFSYELVDLSYNKDLHLKLANQTGQTTVPYIFIDEKFLGGYKDLEKLSETGGILDQK